MPQWINHFNHRCVFAPFSYHHEPHSNFLPKPNADAESLNNMSNDLFIHHQTGLKRIRYLVPRNFHICVKGNN